jgi:F-type H+-transporting ATPase subunit epsilon
MADAFGVEVVTPERALLAGPATAVMLRTSDGNLTVLDGHTPLIGDVVPGEVRVEQEDGTVVHLAVHGGFIQVDTRPGAAEGLAEGTGPIGDLSTKVTVLAGVAELAEEIDVERATRSKETLEGRLSELRGSGSRGGGEAGADEGAEIDLELLDVTTSLDRANLRLEIAGAQQPV